MDNLATLPQRASVPAAAVPPFTLQHVPSTKEALASENLIASVWRSRGLILACGIAVGVAGWLGTKALIAPRYTAEALVAVESQRFAIPEVQGALTTDSLPDPLPQVRTEAQVLRSRALVQSVIDQMHLAEVPEFNPLLQSPSALASAKRAVLAAIPEGVRQALEGVGVHLPTGEGEPMAEAAVRDAVLGEVTRSLAVVHDNRSTMLSVRFTDVDAARAAAVANALVKRYSADKDGTRRSANREANSLIMERVAAVRADMEALQRRLQETRQRHRLVETRAGSVSQQQLEELSTALTKMRAERAEAEAKWQRAAAAARSGVAGADAISDVVVSGTIARLRDAEGNAAREAAEYRSRYGQSHPDLQASEAQLAATRATLASEISRIVASLRATYDAARAREADLARQVEEARVGAQRLATVQSELADLDREAESQRLVYQQLLGRAEQASNSQRGLQQTGARIVSEAATPGFPSSPKPKLAGLLGLFAGFGFGGLLAVFRGRADHAFRQARDIPPVLGVPALATILRSRRVRGVKGSPLVARVVLEPRGPEAEALRALRARLRFTSAASAEAGGPRSVLFVSALPGEGASSIAAAFARVAAADGVRTLLVEGDLQDPGLSALLEVEPSDGVIDALAGTGDLRDLVASDPDSPAHLLLAAHAAGGMESARRPLLESSRLHALLSRAAQDYDLVVLDAPPAAVLTDALILAHAAEATVLVIEAGATQRDAARDAVERLLMSARGLAGVVLNKAGAQRRG